MSPSSVPPKSPDNSLKRKDPPTPEPVPNSPPSPSAVNPVDLPTKTEYENGEVICEVCGNGISFRDEDSGEFNLKQWDAHRLNWYLQALSAELR